MTVFAGLIVVWLFAPIALARVPSTNQRMRYNFNSRWTLLVGDPANAQTTDFDDSSWKAVTTPHAWNEDDAFRRSIADLPTGVAWYRKHFKLPANSREKKIFLEFEGIRQGGEFYLNGNFIGRHENGVMAFGFDISDRVRPSPQENVLAVRIDNAWDYRQKATQSTYQWSDRNFYANYGGINRNIIEVAPNSPSADGAKKGEQFILGIVEAEIYQSTSNSNKNENNRS
jgi:beta-galactosidase